MRLIRFVLAALAILFVVGPSFTQQPQQGQQQGQGQPQPRQPFPVDDVYTTYTSMDDFFRVNTPCTFEVKDIQWLSEFENQLPGRVYSCNKGAEKYSVTVINYTDIHKIYQAKEHTDAASQGQYWRIDVVASVAYAATKLRNEATKVTYDAWACIDYIPGHQLQYTNANGSRTFAGIYLHEYRLYILKATVPPDSLTPGLFQQSMAILRPDGTQVRYGNPIYSHPW
jgi:hypothetical protein